MNEKCLSVDRPEAKYTRPENKVKYNKRVLKNAQFCSSSRKAII